MAQPALNIASQSQLGSSGSSSKNSKKNLDSYYLVTRFDFLSLKKDVNVASKSNKQKIELKN